jgi:hypothetical protein
LIAGGTFPILAVMRRGRAVLLACAVALTAPAISGRAPLPGRSSFAAEIARLSEPAGFFDTDNLISNEGSYLDVVPDLVASGASGGAYVGVGPDTSFSYIARIRPAVAYIIDVRRDNLLLHLLLKGLFAEAVTRVEYASLLTGRAQPAEPGRWREATIDEIVAYIDGLPAAAGAVQAARRRRLAARISGFGVPLTAADRETIWRFHGSFIAEGLDLRFRSHGRVPRTYYPSLRDLLLAKDRAGRQRNYLAVEDDYQFIRALQAADRVIPVVGDVAGTHALRAIGAAVSGQALTVSAFYISNVESYLNRARYAGFVENIKRLPRTPRSVMIRSFFGGGPSTSALQTMGEMLRGL